MSRLRVGTPSGVGDVMWCMAKLKALAAGRRVTLCIQSSQYDRAIDLANMVDFVAGAEFMDFDPGVARETGYAENVGGLNMVMWPNAFIDRGERIETWLPHLAMDLNFELRTPDMGPPRTVVYASSVAINETWMQGKGAAYWVRLIADLAQDFGRITLVGAAWDAPFRDQLQGMDVEDLVGKTTLPQLAGIIRNARIVVGVICGITIIANHLRTPCIAVWPDWKFPPSFPYAWVAKDAPYVAVPVSALATVNLRAVASALAR